jgi:signal transduction histidine kinase
LAAFPKNPALRRTRSAHAAILFFCNDFCRVEKSRSREKGGAGLGRPIARKILDLHGSALDVESTVGEGTTFSFAAGVAQGNDLPFL